MPQAAARIHRARRRADKEIGVAQQRRRFDEAEIAGIDGGRAHAPGNEILRTRKIGRAADQEDRAVDAAAQQRNEFRPMLVRPILVGMRGADAERDPRPGASLEPFGDAGERCVGQMQIRLGREERHFHGGHQRAQPIDRLIVKMAVVDAGIGDEQALRSKPKPDALRYAGKPLRQAPGGVVRSRIQIERNLPRRSSAASRSRLMPRCSSEPACSK